MAGYYSKLIKSDLSNDGVSRRVHRIMLFDLPDFDPTNLAPNIIEDEFREDIERQFLKFSEYNVTIDILSICGYDKNDQDKAQRRAETLLNLIDGTKRGYEISDEKLTVTPRIQVVTDKALCPDRFCMGTPEDYLYRSAEIVYMIIVRPPEFIPQCTSVMWKVSLDENIGLLHSVTKTKKGIAAEIGFGSITQFSPENCNESSDNISRSFCYFSLGLEYGNKIPKIDPADSFKTFIQKLFDRLGIGFQSSSPFNLPNGQFTTERAHNLQDFGNALLVNCTVKATASAGVTAQVNASLIVMAIPVHDENGLNFEIVGSVIIGIANGISFDSKIGTSASLSLTAGVIHFV